MNELSILKEVLISSTQLTTWALGVGAGSVALIVSTSNHRPDSIYHRISYLLFIPGWLCIGYTVYLGNLIASKYLASTMVEKKISIISSNINDLYSEQQYFLLISLSIFFIWLLIFTITWVFSNKFSGIENK